MNETNLKLTTLAVRFLVIWCTAAVPFGIALVFFEIPKEQRSSALTLVSSTCIAAFCVSLLVLIVSMLAFVIYRSRERETTPWKFRWVVVASVTSITLTYILIQFYFVPSEFFEGVLAACRREILFMLFPTVVYFFLEPAKSSSNSKFTE